MLYICKLDMSRHGHCQFICLNKFNFYEIFYFWEITVNIMFCSIKQLEEALISLSLSLSLFLSLSLSADVWKDTLKKCQIVRKLPMHLRSWPVNKAVIRCLLGFSPQTLPFYIIHTGSSTCFYRNTILIGIIRDWRGKLSLFVSFLVEP